MSLYSNSAPLSEFADRRLAFQGSFLDNLKLGVAGYDKFGNRTGWGKAKGAVLSTVYGATGAIGAAALGIDPATGAKIGTALGGGINKISNGVGRKLLVGTDGEDQANQAAVASAQQSDMFGQLINSAAGLASEIQGAGKQALGAISGGVAPGVSSLTSGAGGVSPMSAASLQGLLPSSDDPIENYKRQIGGVERYTGLPASAGYLSTPQTRFAQFKNGGPTVPPSILETAIINPSSLIGVELPISQYPLPENQAVAGTEYIPQPTRTLPLLNRIVNAEGSNYNAKNNVGPGHYGKYQFEPALIHRYARVTPEVFLKNPQLQEQAMQLRLKDLYKEAATVKAKTNTGMSLDDIAVGIHFKGQGGMTRELNSPRLMYLRSKKNPSTAEYIYGRSYGQFANGGQTNYAAGDDTEDYYMVDKNLAKRVGLDKSIEAIRFGEARYNERIFDQDSNELMKRVMNSKLPDTIKIRALGEHVFSEIQTHSDFNQKKPAGFILGGNSQYFQDGGSVAERRRRAVAAQRGGGATTVNNAAAERTLQAKRANEEADRLAQDKRIKEAEKRVANDPAQKARLEVRKRQLEQERKQVNEERNPAVRVLPSPTVPKDSGNNQPNQQSGTFTDRNYRTQVPQSVPAAASRLKVTGLPSLDYGMTGQQPLTPPSWTYPNAVGDMSVLDAQAKISRAANELGIKLPKEYALDSQWGEATNQAYNEVLRGYTNRYLAQGKTSFEAAQLASADLGVSPKIGQYGTNAVGLAAIKDPRRINDIAVTPLTPNKPGEIGIQEAQPIVPASAAAQSPIPSGAGIKTGNVLRKVGEFLPDIARIGTALVMNNANQPKGFDPGQQYRQIGLDLQNRANQGLSGEQRSAYSNQLNQGYAQGVGTLRNLVGGGANQAAVIAGLGRLGNNYNQGVQSMNVLDAQARDTNRLRYQSFVMNDLGVRQGLYQQQEQQKAVNRQAAGQLLGATMQNIQDRRDYQRDYGPDSMYAKLQQSMIDQTNAQTQAAKDTADAYAKRLGVTPLISQPGTTAWNSRLATGLGLGGLRALSQQNNPLLPSITLAGDTGTTTPSGIQNVVPKQIKQLQGVRPALPRIGTL